MCSGFDASRAALARARTGAGFSQLPPLDGTLTTDPAALAAAADDFGHIVHRTPVAVLRPGSVEDVVKMVRFAREHGIRVSGRGKGHTAFGQSQAGAGVVVDMTTLNQIHSVGPTSAVVDAGVVWRDLLQTTIP